MLEELISFLHQIAIDPNRARRYAVHENITALAARFSRKITIILSNCFLGRRDLSFAPRRNKALK